MDLWLSKCLKQILASIGEHTSHGYVLCAGINLIRILLYGAVSVSPDSMSNVHRVLVGFASLLFDS